MKNKHAQTWGIDLMTATVIFLLVLVVFFVYSINQSGEARSIIEDLLYDGKVISNSLLSEGSPDDWNSWNVARIGITDNGKINETKLERFYNLAQMDYEKTKTTFGMKYDYYFFLENNMTINSIEVEGIGKQGVAKNYIESNSKNLIKVTRFAIYREKPTTAYFYIWGES